MKNSLILSLLALLACVYPAFAQDLTITEKKMSFGDEAFDALVVNVLNPEEAKASIEKYAKDKLGLKLKKDDKETLIAEKISMPTIIPSKRGDFMVLVNASQMAIAYRMGYDFILNSQEYPEEMFRFKQLMNDILFTYYVDGFNAQIAAKEAQIKDYEKEIAKNTRESEKLSKDMQKNNKKIGKADDTEKVTMENENINAQNQQAALADINTNLNNEIRKLNDEINTIRQSINELSQKAANNLPKTKE